MTSDLTEETPMLERADAPPEAVRLVIWDLDETFWTGTLTEGGIQYNQVHHDLVVALNRRGIVNSICSKNDPEQVRRVLQEKGIWDQFVFPSISWEAKGPRIKTLVEKAQLRPSTVLFIDDNPMNIREAKYFLPDIQVADETVIARLLEDPRMVGKDDVELSRLRQYKVLERKDQDLAATAGSASDFLRASGIRVWIEHDVEKHLDRAVELINRTNQLNFTKSRLPEDPDEAAVQLREQLKGHLNHAGLIHVSDRYGDYGFVGFYLITGNEFAKRVEHYCFSCRTLGMNIETWLYRKLGRPALGIVGEVLTDIRDETSVIDWIELASAPEETGREARSEQFDRIILRGGCDLLAMEHYVGLYSSNVVSEVNQPRDGYPLRTDHSVNLRLALEGVPPEAMQSLRRLGFKNEDFRTALKTPTDGRDLWILSFWIDAMHPVYRHRTLGFRTTVAQPHPFHVPGERPDLTTVDTAEIPQWLRDKDHWIVDAFRALREDYEWEDMVPGHIFKDTLSKALGHSRSETQIYILAALERYTNEAGHDVIFERHRQLNDWCREVVADFPHAELVEFEPFVQSPSDLLGVNHYNRSVYHKVYNHIISRAVGK